MQNSDPASEAPTSDGPGTSGRGRGGRATRRSGGAAKLNPGLDDDYDSDGSNGFTPSDHEDDDDEDMPKRRKGRCVLLWLAMFSSADVLFRSRTRQSDTISRFDAWSIRFS